MFSNRQKSTCSHPKVTQVTEDTGIVWYRCDECGAEITHWRRKVANWWILFRYYCGRGEGYIQEINGLVNTMGGLGVVWLLIFGFSAGSKAWLLVIFWLFQKIVVFYIGLKDTRRWGMAQRESLFNSQFQPSLVETLRILNNLEKKISPETSLPSVLERFYENQKIAKQRLKEKTPPKNRWERFLSIWKI